MLQYAAENYYYYNTTTKIRTHRITIPKYMIFLKEFLN